ncbi:MAG: 3-deoxy-manno-octulosonate cytidylyltransferase [Proteobacteria bacterium]|nr:3-deoxy-manno-octulosonate cytidylyltransferase [Pseudomonadota bacterium]
MAEPRFVVAIPARMGATRLPGKPLRLLGGDPLIVHVVRRAQAAGADEVVVATDDARIADALHGCGVQVCMTRADHASGTDRLAECAALRGWDDERIVVNLQGDEPFAPPDGIRAVARCLADSDSTGAGLIGAGSTGAGSAGAGAPMATLAEPIKDLSTLFDPNAVKIVRAGNGDALYFSRAPIPWDRARFARERIGAAGAGWLRHIGIYAYRAGFLRQFAALPPGRLERIESLEQLRVLEAGLRIAVALTPAPFPPGVDTEADLLRAEQFTSKGVVTQ